VKGRCGLASGSSLSSSRASVVADLTAPPAGRAEASCTSEEMSASSQEPSLPNQEERMGIELASRCLDILRSEGSSMCSEVTGTAAAGGTGTFSRDISGIPGDTTSVSLENSAISQETTTMHLDLRSYCK